MKKKVKLNISDYRSVIHKIKMDKENEGMKVN